MPNPSTISRGNIIGSWALSPTLTPSSVAPNTAAEQTFTVAGLQLGDFIDVAQSAPQAGLSIGNARVTAVNTLGIQFINATAATITPTAGETYGVVVTRAENLANNVSILTQIT